MTLVYLSHSSFRAHAFDDPSARKTNPKRKSGVISEPMDSARGAEGVRSFHRDNAEKIPMHRRYGYTDDEILDMDLS